MDDIEQIRLCILRYCLRPTATAIIVASLHGEGFRHVKRQQALDAIQYLQDKGLLTHESKQVSPENKLWRTTAAGRDLLAEQGA